MFCILRGYCLFAIICFRGLSVWSLKDPPLRTLRSLKELKGVDTACTHRTLHFSQDTSLYLLVIKNNHLSGNAFGEWHDKIKHSWLCREFSAICTWFIYERTANVLGRWVAIPRNRCPWEQGPKSSSPRLTIAFRPTSLWLVMILSARITRLWKVNLPWLLIGGLTFQWVG